MDESVTVGHLTVATLILWVGLVFGLVLGVNKIVNLINVKAEEVKTVCTQK